jgi:ribosomal-protein-alanine N-acetyltransferase
MNNTPSFPRKREFRTEQPAPDTGILVRQLVGDDLDAVMEIENASFSAPWSLSTFRSLLRRGDADVLAAVEDGQLRGYAICWTILDQAELGNVAVAGDARRRGVARMLVRAALDRARERGAAECYLEVRHSNLAARSLYETHGFEVISRRRRYYSNPTEDAIVMRAVLV